MTGWLKSPSGWPVYADSADEQAELADRGYDVITEDQVQAAIDAFHAAEASPPSTQLPGWALASDVAAALATKANASSLPGKLSITDIGNPATSGGAALRDAFGTDPAQILYVTATGNDANNGLAPGKAKATITAAINTLRDAGIGGRIMVGDGTFAPILLSATTTGTEGIEIVGLGLDRTFVESTAAGVDALRIESTANANSPSFITVRGISFKGVGNGVNLGGATWNQMGHIRIEDCDLSGNAGDGLRAYDLNNCVFINCRIRDNGGYGVRVTGNIADGTGSVFRGNTVVWMNVSTSNNALGGWLFDNVGVNFTLIGGEQNNHPVNKYAVTVVPGPNMGEISFLGTHFERNWRSVLLGDHSANGHQAVMVKLQSCYFGNGGVPKGGLYDVVLDSVEQVDFDNCQFGETAGIKLISGVNNAFSWRNIRATQSIIEDASGNKITRVLGHGVWGRAGSRIVQIASEAADDSYGEAPDYIETARPVPTLLRRVKTLAGTVDDWFGNGTPEGVITAAPGSTFRRSNGAAGSTFYVKQTGTGNTGWLAIA